MNAEGLPPPRLDEVPPRGNERGNRERQTLEKPSHGVAGLASRIRENEPSKGDQRCGRSADHEAERDDRDEVVVELRDDIGSSTGEPRSGVGTRRKWL
jgi:hypothetical protein